MSDRTGNLDPAVLETVVSDVLISAYGNESNVGVDGEPPTNAWAIFLKTAESESVQIVIYPKTNLVGQLSFEARTYVGTYNQVKTVMFPTLDTPTVQRLVNLIYGNGRHRFRFTAQKEGCRHWVLSVIADFENAGILGSGTKAAAQDVLSKYWLHPADSGSVARMIRACTFF